LYSVGAPECERNVVSGAMLEPEASADCYPLLLLCGAELGFVCLLVYSFFLLVLVLCGGSGIGLSTLPL